MTFGDTFAPQPVPPAEEPPSGPSLGQIVLGALLLLVGLGWLLQALDIATIPWQAVLPAALIVVGIALIAGARDGAHTGLVVAGVILTLVMAVGSSVDALFDVPFTGGIGERSVRPASLEALDSPYRLAIGDLQVDLSALPAPTKPLEITATIGIGRLVVQVPPDVDVEVNADVAVGNSIIFGVQEGGLDLSRRTGAADDEPRLVLDVAVGIGELVVRR